MATSSSKIEPVGSRHLQTGLIATLLLAALSAGSPVQAQAIWKPKPNVADDTGNWTSSTFQELQIRLNGHTGYSTSDLVGLLGAKAHHPQHMVRLPNAIGTDGKWHAYFAITQSNRFYNILDYHTDGYFLVAEIDADAYDRNTDQIVDTPGSDGRFVYEEHFNDDRDAARSWYSEELNALGSQFKISLVGDWGHPGKMSAFGGVLLIAAQNWSPDPVSTTVGTSLDAVLFYDVRDPVHPRYLGKLDVKELGLPYALNKDGTEKWNSNRCNLARYQIEPQCQIDIDSIGLARFENGWYHLGVQENNYVCHEDSNCFDPPTMSKWSPKGKTGSIGGQQGDIYHSREIYAEVPAADEPCYNAEGLRVETFPPYAGCAPAGTFRVMWQAARDYYDTDRDANFGESVLPNSWLLTCEVFSDKACGSQDQGRQGIPRFTTLRYDTFSHPTFEMDGTGAFAGRFEDGRKNQFFTQLNGDCRPTGTISVNDQREALIYCVSESRNEPIDCPDGGKCNRIFQNAAGAAPNFGVIRFTNSTGQSVTYRGRGLDTTSLLSKPPWGPCVSGCPPGAVDWATTQLATVEIISGTWLFYENSYFETGGGRNSAGPGVYPFRTLGLSRLGSFRVLPERGISLFEHGNFFGRMVNLVGSKPDLSRTCGDSFDRCQSLAREEHCGLLSNPFKECVYPRTFNDKTSSFIVASNKWNLFVEEDFDGSKGRTGSLTAASPGAVPSIGKYFANSNDQISSADAWCQEPSQSRPSGLQYTIPADLGNRPLVTWVDSYPYGYEVFVRAANGTPATTPFPTMQSGTSYMPAVALAPGTYTVSVRHGPYEFCAMPPGPSSDALTVTIPAPPPPPVRLTVTSVAADSFGIGSGTVSVSPPPVSEVGGSFYAPGTIVTLTAAPSPQSEFAGWSGTAQAASCGTAPACEVTIAGAAVNVSANFRGKPRLYLEKQGNGTVGASPAGTDCATGACMIYPTGTVVALTATPASGSLFTGWIGDPDCSDASVTMTDVFKTCIAVFSRTDYLLTVLPSGSGSVVSVPAGAIACGTAGTDCTESYPAAGGPKAVQLLAQAAAGFQFVRWHGDLDCWDENGGLNPTTDLTVGAVDVSCSPLFVRQGTEYGLTLQKRGVGARASRVTATVLPGTVLPGIDCPLAACTAQVAVGSRVRLTATPVRGAKFDYWSGGAGCTLPQIPDPKDPGSGLLVPDPNPVITVTMTASQACQANFSAKILLINGSDDQQLTTQYVSMLNAVDADDLDYDEWTVRNPGLNPGQRVEPTAADLADYTRVVWYTGRGETARGGGSPPAGPSPAAEASLATFLNGGGCLLIDSPQYAKDRGVTAFAKDYLGVGSVTQDVAPTQVTGTGLVPFFAVLPTVPLTADEGLPPSSSDAIVPSGIAGTHSLLKYGTGTAAVGRDNGIYRSAYFGFALPMVPSGTRRNGVMRAFADYCLQIDRDDRFEPNDDFEFATGQRGNVSLADLKILPGNDDYFRWQADANALTTFHVSFEHAAGDLTLELYDGARQLIASSQSSNDDEEIVGRVSADEFYYLRVSGVGAAGNHYTVSVGAGAPDLDGDGVPDAIDAFPTDPLEWLDTDGDGIGNNADTDDDGDGMPDAWEIRYGLNPLSASDAAQDADGDGFDNLEEFRAGSDPRDPGSVPPQPPAGTGAWNCDDTGECTPAGAFAKELVVPIVLTSSGVNNSFFTSELALTNRGSTDASISYSYTAAFGGASGTETDSLRAGHQKTVSDAIAYLQGLGIPVGGSGNRGGTLRITFSGLSSSDAGAATIRTTTSVAEGRAGLAYTGLPSQRLLSAPVYLCGLRQNATDRSNVAVLHAGGPSDGNITLRLTVVSGDPANPKSQALPDITLPPGGFNQISGILAANGLGLTNGTVRVERVAGSAPFFTYGVINDQANSDGSFVEPINANPVSAITGLTLPVIVETSTFSSELVLANLTSSPRTVQFSYVSSTLPGGSVSFNISLLPSEQQILPDFVQVLRSRGVIPGAPGQTLAGALFATDASGDLRGISIGARTSAPGGGGRYGLYYSAVPAGSEATTSAWLYGLQQNAENRTNLALVNVGSPGSSTDVFRIDLYVGATGQKVATVDNVSVPARGFVQINAILALYAAGVEDGYALVTRTSGSNPFIAYAVVNDGGQAGQRTGDGAFVSAIVPAGP